MAAVLLSSCGTTHPGSAPTSAGPRPTAPVSSAAPSTAAAPPTSATAPSTACSTDRVLATWPAPRLAAQLLVAPVLDYDAATLRDAIGSGVGGILFLGPAPPPAGLAALLGTAAPPRGVPRPLVMADEEGGAVQRLLGAVAPLPSARAVASTMTAAQIGDLGRSVGRQMAALGVDTDLAPVLDLDAGPGPSETDADGTRSYSLDPAVAARDGIAMLGGLQAGGVLPVVKHFPGLGGASGNTDVGPASTRDLHALLAAGLRPFEAAIAAGAPAVMVANASVPGLTTGPASLSPAVIGTLLRSQLGFNGVVLTDSLSAGAVRAAGYDLPAATLAAVAAGADMVLWGSTLTPADTSALTRAGVARTDALLVDTLVSATRTGALPVTTLVRAAAAVLRAKHADLCAAPTGPPTTGGT